MSENEKLLLIPGSRAGRELFEADLKYCSKLGQWDRVASVRTKPRRTLQHEIAAGALAFPKSLLPLLRTRVISRLEPDIENRMAAQALYRYLEFTDPRR